MTISKTIQYQANPAEDYLLGLLLIDRLYETWLTGLIANILIVESSSVYLYVPVTYPIDLKMDNSPIVLCIKVSLFKYCIAE